MKSLSEITSNDRTDWKRLMNAMDSGRKVQVNKDVYFYFLEVLPPRAMYDDGFAFAEGAGPLYRFSKKDGKFFVQKTKKFGRLQ